MPALRSQKAPTIRVNPAARPDPSTPVHAERGFAHAAQEVLQELQAALGALLEAAPTEISRAVHVERAFGLDHQTGWQVFQIVAAANPLMAVGHVPAPSAIQRLIKAALRRRVPAETVQRVSTAYEAFDAVVRDYAGDRAEFDAMARSLTSDIQDNPWLSSKESVFRGARQIRGVAMETFLQARFLYPSADGTHIDAISLSADLGLRRLHPAAKIGFGIMPLSSGFRPKTLDGREPEGPTSLLLPEFCSRPLPKFETVEIEGALHFWVVGNDIGLKSAIDLVTGYRAEGRWPRIRETGGRSHAGVHEVIDVPTGRLTFDVFAHQDLFGGASPELAVYQTVAHGVVSTIGDPKREDDRLRLGDAVHPIPGGVAGAGLSHAPNYLQMLDGAREQTGCAASAFKGWRVDVIYPMYGAQYSIRFPLPESTPGRR